MKGGQNSHTIFTSMLQLSHNGSICCTTHIMVVCRLMCRRPAVILVPKNIPCEDLRLRDKGESGYKLCMAFKSDL